MLVRIFVDCLCVLSICIILWGISPAFVVADCRCDSPTYVCSDHEDSLGNCVTSVTGKLCKVPVNPDCICRTLSVPTRRCECAVRTN
jgi:hypothetical protein